MTLMSRLNHQVVATGTRPESPGSPPPGPAAPQIRWQWVREISPGGPGWWHRRYGERASCVCGVYVSNPEIGSGEGSRHPDCDPDRLRASRSTPTIPAVPSGGRESASASSGAPGHEPEWVTRAKARRLPVRVERAA